MKNIKIDWKYLNHLRLADDIVFIADNVIESQEMLKTFNEISKEDGVHINFKNTQVMTNSKINEDL